MNVDNHIYWAPGTSEKEIYGQLAQFHREIAREDIKLSRKIGQGAFGVVYKAELNSSQGSMEVAVKQVKKNSPEEERVKLLQEAAILGQFKHKHITSLLGVVTADQPVSYSIVYCVGVMLELPHYMLALMYNLISLLII